VKSLGEIIARGLHHAELDAQFRTRNLPEKRETEHYRQAMIKRYALRAAVTATLEEHRVDALAYPTLRRKPTLIGEPQGGTNCQLSATTGLPAMAMPAGFSTDGLPIALELLGGAWQEAKLLKYAYAWEQATKPRRPPFSTPPLVKGFAPSPTSADLAVGGATLKLNYDVTTGALRYEAAAAKLPVTDRVLGLTIQRSNGDKPGPIVAQLLSPNQITGSGTLTMRGRNREDLVDGKLFVHFYTKSLPLGAGREKIVLR
jgi:hypothetical protein